MLRRVRINPPGYIPVVGQGLIAREEISGSTGGRTWLKSQKLHKYWPTISHLTYSNFITLTEENMDWRLSQIGSSGMTEGAKRKLLRLIEFLRRREEKLAWIRSECSLTPGGGRRADLRLALKSLREILYSPLPEEDPPASLINEIILTVAHVWHTINTGRFPLWVQTKLSQVLEDVKSRPVLLSALEYQSDLNRSRQLPRRPSSPTIQRPLKHISSQRPSPPVIDDWYRPSDEGEGIWPQGENNVSFNIWPRTLLEPDLMTPVGDTSSQSLAARSSVMDAPSSSAVMQFDCPEGLFCPLLHSTAPSGLDLPPSLLQLHLPAPSRHLMENHLSSYLFNYPEDNAPGRPPFQSGQLMPLSPRKRQ